MLILKTHAFSYSPQLMILKVSKRNINILDHTWTVIVAMLYQLGVVANIRVQ